MKCGKSYWKPAVVYLVPVINFRAKEAEYGLVKNDFTFAVLEKMNENNDLNRK